jgi:hypothetical protein
MIYMISPFVFYGIEGATTVLSIGHASALCMAIKVIFCCLTLLIYGFNQQYKPNVNVKVQLVTNVGAMTEDKGSRCVSAFLLTFGVKWKWMVRFTPRPL